MKRAFLYYLLIFALYSCDKSENIPLVFPDEFVVPVIFHVDNSDGSVVDQARIQDLLAKVNTLFKENSTAVQFSLADVQQVNWAAKNLPTDCITFMNGRASVAEPVRQDIVGLLRDVNTYINIFVYPFDSSGGGTILGISWLAFTNNIKELQQLEGLPKISPLARHKDVDFPYCLSLNSRYLGTEYESAIGTSSPADPIVTLAHELGHYLGVFHTFHNGAGTCNGGDSDYCDDTYSYDRDAYSYYEDKYERITCSGITYTARNVMDYAYCYANEFTEDQIYRMQHVLKYSPLIPFEGKVFPFASSRTDAKIEMPEGVLIE